jgi:hypothetical protein
MRFPAFFSQVPRLRVHDPLAEALSSAEGGLLEYGYEDAVRLTGHSCPTVASAYWLTLRALRLLYPDTLPERGGVRVEFRDDPRDGITGVVATVVQMLTGAAGHSGFKGLAGQHRRSGLVRYAPDLPLAMRFIRLDNRLAVDAWADLSLLPEEPAMGPLVERYGRGRLSVDERALLGQLWQARVKRLLLDLAFDDGMFVLRPAAWPWAARASQAGCAAPLPPVARFSEFGALN